MIKSNQLAVLRSFNVLWNRLKNQSKTMSVCSSSQERSGPEVSNDPKFKLTFNNETIHSLPLDSVKENYVRSVSGACFSSVNPTPVKDPKVIVVSRSALELIDINYSDKSQEEIAKDEEFAAIFCGNKLLPGSEPSAHCYAGHQFGSFAGQLGDGAAIYLGEVVNKEGTKWELQLKGAGPTPYSRSADGRKVLRSSLREFLASEFMAALGIPTTRAGSCITSSDTVIRDIFYDGNPIHEKCTIISRIAQTFIRFGSFEIFKPIDSMTGRRGPSVGREEIKKALLDYVIKSYYPQVYSFKFPDEGTNEGENEKINEETNAHEQKMYQEFFKQVTLRTARLVASWQCIGFCHGVLNTDNMSIIGVTIDYGPYGFLDRYDPDHICNASDDGGRYSYSKQPVVCKWNLAKLAEALNPLLKFDDAMKILDENYDSEFKMAFESKMRRKIGLIKKLDSNQESNQVLSDTNIISMLLETMTQTGADFTNTFRSFNDTNLRKTNENIPHRGENIVKDDEIFEQEMATLKEKLINQSCSLNELIASNEGVVKSRDFQIFLMLMQQEPRMLEQIGLSRGSIERMMSKLEEREKLKSMTSESKKEADVLLWNLFVEKYKTRLLYDVNGMTYDAIETLNIERKKLMDENNPVITLRNHIAQKVIQEAEKENFAPTHKLYERLINPYEVMIEDGAKNIGTEGKGVEDESLSVAPSSSKMENVQEGTISRLIKSFYEKSPEEAVKIKVT